MTARSISVKRVASVGLAALVSIVIGWTAHAVVTKVDRRMDAGIDGLSMPLTVRGLIDRADLVVAGSPRTHEVKAFQDAVPASDLPANEQNDPIYLNGSFSRYVVDVDRVIKADSAFSERQLDVRTYASTPGVGFGDSVLRNIEVGQKYVFILFQGPEVWQKAWLILGGNGLAEVQGDTANFPSGEHYSLEDLEAMGGGQ